MIKKFDSFNENQSDYITSEGSKILDSIKKSFPSLMEYYSTEMGIFTFTKEEVRKEIDNITEWIDSHEMWGLISEEGSFFLTSEIK